MKMCKIIILLAGTAIFASVYITYAATKGRILANGTVSLHKNGKVVRSFTEQGPIDENALIACEGTCMVKMKGLSLIAVDNTMFAVKELNQAVNLYVLRGRINFAVSDVSKEFSFYTPGGYFVKTEGFLAPASTDSSVKGYIDVSEKIAEIGMDSGTMLVQTNNGPQTIPPGQSIQLAMVDVPEDGKKEGNDPGGGEVFSWSSLSTGQQVAIIGAGAALTVGVAALTFANTSDGTSQGPGQGGPPITTPPPTPPPPGSRNQ